MPLIPSQIAAQIRLAAPLFTGTMWVPVSEAIGMAVTAWAMGGPQNVMLTGVNTGVLGGGVVTGKLICPPAPPLVIGACTAAGNTGPMVSMLATAASIGVSTAISQSGMYAGPSAGTGSGVDFSKVVSANPATLIALLDTMLRAYTGGGGAGISMLATGLGSGIAANVMLGFGAPGTGAVLGAVGPLPGVGTSPMSVVV
jgi:hypothetical protein